MTIKEAALRTTVGAIKDGFMFYSINIIVFGTHAVVPVGDTFLTRIFYFAGWMSVWIACSILLNYFRGNWKKKS
jgi:hypothetical protein